MTHRADGGDRPGWQTLAWLAVIVAILCALGVTAATATGSSPVATPEPCPPVHYRVGALDAPPTGLGDVRAAFDRVSRATGVRFIPDEQGGEVDVTQLPEPGSVVVLWASGSDSSPLRVGTATSHRDERGVTGRVVLNADAEYPGGFDSRKSWGGVLLHEFGHLVGLDHAQSRDEMMYPAVVDGPAQWGPGDRRLLAEAGRALGCSPPDFS